MMATPSSRKQSFALRNIYLRKKGFRSRTAHRGSPCKVLKSRYTPPILTDFAVKGNPLNNPQ